MQMPRVWCNRTVPDCASPQACARSLLAVQAGAQEWWGHSDARWLHSGAELRSAEPALESQPPAQPQDHAEALSDEVCACSHKQLSCTQPRAH